MPSPEQTTKNKNRFEIMSNPFCSFEEDDSRGPRHGQQQWQYDHWKAKDVTRGLRRGYDMIVQLCLADKRYQESQWNHGWTEHCRYLDYVTIVDVKYIATWPERSRCHNMLVLKVHDEKNPGKMSHRDDCKNLQPDDLFFSGTRKEGKTLTFRSRQERGKYCSMKSCDQNLSCKVGFLGKFMDRRRHLHLRQLGGNHKNGKNDMNGKNDKIGMDGGNGKNEYSFHDPSVIL